MNKKQQELLDEAYEDYVKIVEANKELYLERDGYTRDILTKDEFKRESKYNYIFSEKWGLKIDERELSWEERKDLLTPEQYDGTALNKYGHKDCGFGDISPFTDKVIHYWMNLHNIPTKQITLTYNNKTIESYE
jgi:hypothetical protein